MTRVEILEGTLAKLRRDGWVREAKGPNGELCLINALVEVAQLRRDGSTDMRPVYAPLRALLGVQSTADIVWWNVAPGRTFADVEALLTAAMAIAQEQDQPVQEGVPV